MMVLHCQILFHLAIAEAILMQTSAEQVPSLHRVAPRYLKLVTSSNFIPFMLISALMLFVLLVLILLFSVLTSIPYAVALSTSLLVRYWKFTTAAIHKISVVRKLYVAHLGLPQWRWSGSHGVCPAWTSLGTSWTEWMRVSIPGGHPPLWPAWLGSVLPLC